MSRANISRSVIVYTTAGSHGRYTALLPQAGKEVLLASKRLRCDAEHYLLWATGLPIAYEA